MNIFALITLLVTVAGIVLLSRVLKNFMPNDKRLFDDLKQLREETKEWAHNLVPISSEELDSFSFDQAHQKVAKGFSKKARGVFTTIYHEPVLAYNYREYAGPKQRAILYVETHDQQYSFIKNAKGVRIAVGQREIGTLHKDGVLRSANGGKPLAKVGQDSNNLLPISVEKREIGSIAKLGPQEKLGQRAFQFVPEDISQDEKDIFLSLAALELVNQSLAR